MSQQTLALYFFLAFFALLLFFCWRLGIAAGAAGIRLGCHLGPSAVVACVLDAEATRNTGKQNGSARATALFTFFWDRARMRLPGAVLLGDRLGTRIQRS